MISHVAAVWHNSSYVKNPEELFQLKLRGNPGVLKGFRLGVSRITTISYRKRIRNPGGFLNVIKCSQAFLEGRAEPQRTCHIDPADIKHHDKDKGSHDSGRYADLPVLLFIYLFTVACTDDNGVPDRIFLISLDSCNPFILGIPISVTTRSNSSGPAQKNERRGPCSSILDHGHEGTHNSFSKMATRSTETRSPGQTEYLGDVPAKT